MWYFTHFSHNCIPHIWPERSRLARVSRRCRCQVWEPVARDARAYARPIVYSWTARFFFFSFHHHSCVMFSHADAIYSNKPLWSLLFKCHNAVHISCSLADSNRSKLLAEVSVGRLMACVSLRWRISEAAVEYLMCVWLCVLSNTIIVTYEWLHSNANMLVCLCTAGWLIPLIWQSDELLHSKRDLWFRVFGILVSRKNKGLWELLESWCAYKVGLYL